MTLSPFDYRGHWDPEVKRLIPARPSKWANLMPHTTWPPIDVIRCSASRPWRLEQSTPTLWDRLRYPGPIRQVLVESVVVKEHSDACVRYGLESGYFDEVIVIEPQRGQSYALDYPLRHVVTAPYVLKWDDDMDAVQDIPLETVVRLMEEHPKINQVSFNKRRTVPRKPFYKDEWPGVEQSIREGRDPNSIRPTHGKPITFQKAERKFTQDGEEIVLTVKDRWWFGPALWRMSFIRPLWEEFYGFWKHWSSCLEAPHNQLSDKVLFRLIDASWHGGPWPVGVPARAVEDAVGCYLWGRIGDERMVEHTGKGDSLWSGEFQARMRAEGREVLGDDQRGKIGGV